MPVIDLTQVELLIAERERPAREPPPHRPPASEGGAARSAQTTPALQPAFLRPLATIGYSGFERTVLPREGAAVVLFGAAWQASGEVAAHLRRVADRHGILACFADVEGSPGLARRYGVTAIPSLLLFLGGQEAGRRLGNLSEQAVEDWLAAALP